MARIWRAYEGREPPRGGPWAEMPLADAIKWFDLSPRNFVSAPDETPRFGEQNGDYWYRGYKVVVVEVEHEELKESNWKAGFYRSPLSPREAYERLLHRVVERAILKVLGSDKIVRVLWTPTIDSNNEEAVEITIVLKPGVIDKISGRKSLDGLAAVREQFEESDDNRTPLVRYATEAELADVDGN